VGRNTDQISLISTGWCHPHMGAILKTVLTDLIMDS